MARAATPVEIAQDLCERLSRFRPGQQALIRAKRRLRHQRQRRRQSAGKKGHEYVVEALLRPIITRLAARMLRLRSRHEIPCRIYSSHFHTTGETEDVWRQFFASFCW